MAISEPRAQAEAGFGRRILVQTIAHGLYDNVPPWTARVAGRNRRAPENSRGHRGRLTPSLCAGKPWTKQRQALAASSKIPKIALCSLQVASGEHHHAQHHHLLRRHRQRDFREHFQCAEALSLPAQDGEDQPRQLVYYDPGVGTLARPDPWHKFKQDFNAILGLATGYGLDDNVLAAYSFLVHTWQPGDQTICSASPAAPIPCACWRG